MASFRIENLTAFSRAKARLEGLRAGGAKVISRAASTLKRRLPAAAKRDIGAQYNLPSRKIGSRLRCTAEANSVTLTAKGRPQALANFGARQNAGGVTVQVEKGRALQISHAFIRVPAGAPGAGPQVMIREAALSLASLPDNVFDGPVVDHNRHGYPLTLLLGPSVGDMLRFGDRETRLVDQARETFAAEVDRLTETGNGK
jgi:hypothetical protein